MAVGRRGGWGGGVGVCGGLELGGGEYVSVMVSCRGWGKMYFCLVLGFVRQVGGRWGFGRSRQVRARVGWNW